jgi:hypothetical protein
VQQIKSDSLPLEDEVVMKWNKKSILLTDEIIPMALTAGDFRKKKFIIHKRFI